MKTIKLLTLLLFAHLSLITHASDVQLPLANSKLTAVANYVKGDTNKPAILILHGFLTNNKFHTIAAMEDILQMEGYATLSPNLTLGINRRRDALSCTSIHTHTLQQDMAEIDQWINWLTQQGYKKVILLGHSSGSQELLEYLSHYPAPAVSAAIFTSSFYLNGKELGTKESELLQATKDLETGYKQPRSYSFLFCQNNYNATAESFHSYQLITRERLLQTLKSLKIPHYTIMGGGDERYHKVGLNWLTDLAATGTQLHIVDAANHFFSSDSEPKLQDVLAQILHQKTAP